MGRMGGRPGRVISRLLMSKSESLTKAPTTIIRVKSLKAKENAEYPEDPACNVCNGAQDPVTTRAGNSGRVWIRKLCNSMNNSAKNTILEPRRLTQSRRIQC